MNATSREWRWLALLLVMLLLASTGAKTRPGSYNLSGGDFFAMPLWMAIQHRRRP